MNTIQDTRALHEHRHYHLNSEPCVIPLKSTRIFCMRVWSQWCLNENTYHRKSDNQNIFWNHDFITIFCGSITHCKYYRQRNLDLFYKQWGLCSISGLYRSQKKPNEQFCKFIWIAANDVHEMQVFIKFKSAKKIFARKLIGIWEKEPKKLLSEKASCSTRCHFILLVIKEKKWLNEHIRRTTSMHNNFLVFEAINGQIIIHIITRISVLKKKSFSVVLLVKWQIS